MFVYKASYPGSGMTFEPGVFYRSADYAVSSNRPGEGLVRDELLYAGDIAGITLHLFPRIDRLCVALDSDVRRRLRRHDHRIGRDSRALVVIQEADCRAVREFSPTIYVFDAKDFSRVASGEFVARKPVEAVRVDRYRMDQALRRWKVELLCVPDLERCEASFRVSNIPFSTQKFDRENRAAAERPKSAPAVSSSLEG
jgi:hypothetical protein